MIVINIEKEKIQWKPVQTKTGVRHFANLVVDNLKEVDEKENTHSVYNNQSKEDRAEKKKKEYCHWSQYSLLRIDIDLWYKSL